MRRPDFTMLTFAVAIAFSPIGAAKKYKGPDPGQPTATITLAIDTESAAKASLRGARMDVYDPAHCTQGLKLTRFFLGDRATGKSEAVTIGAGTPVGITLYYTDARHAENRSCALSGAFTPRPGAHYLARFHVTTDIGRCDVVVSRVESPASESLPEFTIRPLVCPEPTTVQLKSGTGYNLRWNVAVEVRRY